MPVTMVGTRAVARVGINGTEVPLTLDSGAFFSFLTEAAAQQLELPLRGLYGTKVRGLTGSVDARLTTVKRLQLTQGEIPNVDFIVGGNEPGGGTMGLLGRNLLTLGDAEFDLAHGMVRLIFPEGDCDNTDMAYWANGTPVSELELRQDRSSSAPAIKATAQLNGTNITVEFDTGAMSVISLAAARRAGMADADMKPAGMIHGLGRGEAKAWTAPVRKWVLGGEAIEHSRLRIGEFSIDDVDMLVGIDFFLSHRVYVSKKQRRMYFTYQGGPVFALNAHAVTEADAAFDADAPADADGFARRGAAWAARRDYVRALADLDRACEMAPQAADYFTRRGQVHVALKHFTEALQDYTTALRLDPAQAEARLSRAQMRAASGDRDGALGDLQALDQVLAAQADMRRDMAGLYDRLDRLDLSLAQWNLWIPSHRNEVDLDHALNGRCWARAMLGIELDKALADCDDALDHRPKEANYLDSRAWVQLRRGRLRDALSDYDRALEIRPDSAWSLYGRGLARTKMGQVDQGLADIEKARELSASIDEALRRHGLAQVDAPGPRQAP
ncbi:MAG TPA: aspartyl protease family protein [Burkholderiaceae bacterium]